jgi:hypothetical protein
MSFVVDSNFIITLKEIGHFDSISKFREVLVPKTVKDELHNFDSDIQSHKIVNIQIIDVSDDETARFVAELAKKLRLVKLEFILELKDQVQKISLPIGWKSFTNIMVQNTAKALSNVMTNKHDDEIVVQTNAQTRVLGHADVHVCTLVCRNKKSYVLTMDTSIWRALYTIDPKFRDRIKPLFSCLKLMFRDDPKAFIMALTVTIEKRRYKFARNLLDNDASHICLEDLEKSVNDVLSRYLSDVVDKKLWDLQKDNITELISLRERVRNIVKDNTHLDGELTFNDEQFIKELKGVHTSLISLEQQINR